MVSAWFLVAHGRHTGAVGQVRRRAVERSQERQEMQEDGNRTRLYSHFGGVYLEW
jgi:hypothetical protein